MQANDNWMAIVCRFIFAITSIFSNSLIIYTIQRSPKLRSKAYNGLICILAFADLFVGIGLLIRVTESVIHELQPPSRYSMRYCTILGAVHLFGYHMNQMAIVIIAFDRLYGIISPIGYKNRDPKPYVFRSFLLVLIPAIAGIAIRLRELQFEEGETDVCNLSTTNIHGFFAVFWWSPFFLGNSIIIFVIYGVTICLVRRGFQKEGSEREFSRQRKVFLTISLVLLTYICCTMMPAIFVSIGIVAKADSSWFSAVCIYGGLVSGFNSASNILIYGWKYEELRTAMIQPPPPHERPRLEDEYKRQLIWTPGRNQSVSQSSSRLSNSTPMDKPPPS